MLLKIAFFICYSFNFLLLQIVYCEKSLWVVPKGKAKLLSFTAVWNAKLMHNSEVRARTTEINVTTWPKGKVPYVIDDTFFPFEATKIENAMKEIESISCIKFVKRTKESDFLQISNHYLCTSNVGFVGRRQLMGLSTKLCMTKGIIVHELLHALGFVHEHCRDDRDDYITVDESNVDPQFWYNFIKYEKGKVDHVDPYDFDSIMHYDAFAFAVDPTKPVIKALIPGANLSVRENMSPIDIRKLNRLYKC